MQEGFIYCSATASTKEGEQIGGSKGNNPLNTEVEQLFIKSMPYKVMHDGHFRPSEFDPSKSASNVPAQSEVYYKHYQLFPFGRKQLWEERVNVRFCYDERHGTGTWKISSRGMHILGMEIRQITTSLARELVQL